MEWVGHFETSIPNAYGFWVRSSTTYFHASRRARSGPDEYPGSILKAALKEYLFASIKILNIVLSEYGQVQGFHSTSLIKIEGAAYTPSTRLTTEVMAKAGSILVRRMCVAGASLLSSVLASRW